MPEEIHHSHQTANVVVASRVVGGVHKRVEGRLRTIEQDITMERTKRERQIKARIHITCVCVGGVLAIIVTFIPFFDPLAHIAPALPFAPSAVQELLDRIIGL